MHDRRLRAGGDAGAARPRLRPGRPGERCRAGWRATTVDFTDGAAAALAPRRAHRPGPLRRARAGRPARCAPWSTEYVDQDARRAAPRSTSAGRRWTTYTDSGGDLALVRTTAATTTLVVGHDVPPGDAGGLRRRPALTADCSSSSLVARARRRAASGRRRASSWQICASFSPRSHSASDSSRSVPPARAGAPPRPAPRGPPRSCGCSSLGVIVVLLAVGRVGRARCRSTVARDRGRRRPGRCRRAPAARLRRRW